MKIYVKVIDKRAITHYIDITSVSYIGSSEYEAVCDDGEMITYTNIIVGGKKVSIYLTVDNFFEMVQYQLDKLKDVETVMH